MHRLQELDRAEGQEGQGAQAVGGVDDHPALGVASRKQGDQAGEDRVGAGVVDLAVAEDGAAHLATPAPAQDRTQGHQVRIANPLRRLALRPFFGPFFEVVPELGILSLLRVGVLEQRAPGAGGGADQFDPVDGRAWRGAQPGLGEKRCGFAGPTLDQVGRALIGIVAEIPAAAADGGDEGLIHAWLPAAARGASRVWGWMRRTDSVANRLIWSGIDLDDRSRVSGN